MVILSASKISTFLSCSYKAYSIYLKHFPRSSGDGAKLGTIIHTILECLVAKNRRDLTSEFTKSNDIRRVPSLFRLASILLKKVRLYSDSSLDKLNLFLSTAIKNDLFCEGALEVITEKEFNIKTDRFHVRGFIDQLALYKDKIKIVDVKSAKSKPPGFNSDDYFNLQGLIYEWVARREYNLPVEVEFKYLKFKKACTVKSPPSSPELLNGLEEWLAYISNYITNFGEDDKFSHLASSGSGKFVHCGGSCGEYNKEGREAHMCEIKYPRVYFVGYDEDDKFIGSSFSKKDLDNNKKIAKVETINHPGCPAFKHLWERK